MRSSPKEDQTFRGFDSAPTAAAPTDLSSPQPFQSSPFQFGHSFWNWIQSDPNLNAEFEQRVKEKINTRLETMRVDFESTLRDEAKARLEKSTEDGRAQGFSDGFEFGKKQGYEERKQTIDDQLERVSQAVATILAAKETILRSHETAWLQALEFVLIQCLVPRQREVLVAVQLWLSEQLSEFSRTKAVRLLVSPSQFPQYQGALGEMRVESLVLVADEKLRSGEVQVECDNGGIIFSDQDVLERLRLSIQSVLAER
ncbi:MAG: hypothetical protein HYR96_03600 [Deltaproteobacteria bacterium]|nr:hypothetical protein [Deltaproteobacteria bacterium]MBI3295202.1 hypothetical protein [Deltaproteobacteria bacterium]